ncbi:unnamed protein product [Mytilus coruscus]|uniref:AIG1-type G domain-containing protein n=1 Tax=Mytilus coruscus TaxID=42192 RepID=A0A6J8CKS9_MYTCO|nr:unnamed protein product [Mytilus coruscus]
MKYHYSGPSIGKSFVYNKHELFPLKRALRIVIIGKTGAGKRAVSDIILKNRTHFISSYLASASKFEHAIVLGRQVLIIDTPGLLDTSKEKNEFLCEITSDNNKSAPYAVILVLPVDRFTDEYVLTVEQLSKHFGEKLFKHTLVALMASMIMNEKGKTK